MKWPEKCGILFDNSNVGCISYRGGVAAPFMEAQTLIARGVVREGLVVPLGDEELPEGAHVEIRVVSLKPTAHEISAEALTDAERWRRFSEESGASVNWDLD